MIKGPFQLVQSARPHERGSGPYLLGEMLGDWLITFGIPNNTAIYPPAIGVGGVTHDEVEQLLQSIVDTLNEKYQR